MKKVIFEATLLNRHINYNFEISTMLFMPAKNIYIYIPIVTNSQGY